MGKLSNISDIVAYATIIWVGGILLVSFGWQTGKHFWPPVLHLVYMLPLPGTIYYKLSAWLQLISSELGVWFLQLLSVPVFLEGNIIDLGVYKLHVAEACSGLRYLFPILSFSYIFAVLYRGPMWHKAVLLLSAAPITVLMNSVRIADGRVHRATITGIEWVEGFSHFFEGWVIFLACILILFGLARVMLFFNDRNMSLAEALDLDTDGLWHAGAAHPLCPGLCGDDHRGPGDAGRGGLALAGDARARCCRRSSAKSFCSSPAQIRRLGAGRPAARRSSNSVRSRSAPMTTTRSPCEGGQAQPVGFFTAWYEDQSQGGVHSPEICLPGGGWEIAWLERTDMTDGRRQRRPVPDEPRDHPEGRDPDDGLLLVRAEGPRRSPGTSPRSSGS